MPLRIPVITDQMDTLTAALAYAREGWYVIPVTADTKAPTVVGKGWQHQSSTDPEQIVAWFAGTDHALGLHVGRSGAVVFDVDEPDMLPPALEKAILECAPPHQSTRTDQQGRGHYVFLATPGRFLGNGRGQLLHPVHGKKWGEVRGANGIIVAEPSRHVKPNGHYLWLNVEPRNVPPMPAYLDELLPNGTPSLDVANDEAVQTFLAEHAAGSNPRLVKPILSKFTELAKVGSRHEALVEVAAWGMRDAAAGLINAVEFHDELRALFLEAMAGTKGGGRFPASEFQGVIAWAVAQAMGIDQSQRKADVAARLEGDEDDPFGASQMSTTRPKQNVVAPPPAPEGKIRDSQAYFRRDPVTNTDVCDFDILADDVLRAGALAVGRDHRFWEYQDGVWRENEHVVRDRVYDCLLGLYFRGDRVKNTEQVLKARRTALYHLEGDPTPDLINFTNGMLEWRTGALLPHDERYLSTIQLPVAWDPDADCEGFDAWLHSILTPDYVRLAWQMIGYLMMSGNPRQVAFLFLGTGGNGKGTLMRVLKALLGGDNYSAISLDDISGNRFAPAGLYGKLANLAGDIDATFQESTAKFKMLTGEDVFTAENKGQPSFRFENWAVPVFSANKAPGSADTSEGYLRRWIVMKFERSFAAHERILNLDEQFLGELPGIARRGVEALAEVIDRGFFDGGDVQAGKDEFVESIDQVRQWIDQCCEPDDGSEERTALYQSYGTWAHANGVGKLKAQEFYSRLEGAGYPGVKVHGVRRHNGLRVINMRMQSSQLTDPLDAG